MSSANELREAREQQMATAEITLRHTHFAERRAAGVRDDCGNAVFSVAVYLLTCSVSMASCYIMLLPTTWAQVMRI